MKVTKRDLILLCVLAYIAVIVVGVMYFIKPQLDKKPELQTAYDKVESEKISNDNQITQIPILEKDITELAASIEVSEKRFFPLTENPELHINSLFPKEQAANVVLTALNLDKDEVYIADEKQIGDVKNPDDATDVNTWVSNPAKLVTFLNTTAVVSVKGSLENVACNFANNFEIQTVDIDGVQKKVFIEIASVAITTAEDVESTDYQAEYTLNFVSVG